MRILFLTHAYGDTAHGGVAEFLHFLPQALETQQIHSLIYTKGAKNSQKTLMGPEILPNKIARFSGPFLKPQLFSAKKMLKPLIQLCRQEKVDLIHAQGTYRAGYMAMQLNRHISIPYVITSHSDILELNSKRMQRGNVKHRCQKILQRAAYVTHLTPMMADASHQLHDTRHKSTVIHNGIDIDSWLPYLDQPMENYMLAVGRLEPEKGFGIIIEAYAELIKRGLNTSLVIAGSGSMEAELQRKARKLNVTLLTQFDPDKKIPPASIIFTGYVRDLQKKSLFARSRLILFPTQPHLWEEAFGIVQLEAMAAGKYMLASDMKSTRYLQTFGMQAQLVPANDPSAWSEAIFLTLNNLELSQEMGKLNRFHAEQFSWQRAAKEYAELYSSIA